MSPTIKGQRRHELKQNDLADWLARAAERLTHARYLAARSIIADLESTWHTDMGELPVAPWRGVVGTVLLEPFRKVIRAWEGWARANPQFSARFFDDDRQHWSEPR